MLYIIFLLMIASLIFMYFFPIAYVKGESMKPTLQDGDFLLTCRFISVEVGDIAVFYSEETERYNIKRCAEKREYYNPHTKELQYKYYFLGDNEDNSFDSRNYGYINEEDLVAKVILPKNL